MFLEEYKNYFSEDIKLVDDKIISLSNNRPSLIEALVRHIVGSGGKRLRPILLILSSKITPNITEDAQKLRIDMAAAVELFHTATLFHDDVVDESNLRRGKKTANNIWGNSASILVGDFLLSEAFAIMTQTQNLELINILSKTASIITEGEIKQLVFKRNMQITYDDYIDIISAKTAELFAASCRVGGVISGASKTQKDHLEAFGKNLGIIFQIADDALDYVGQGSETIGKKIGDDLNEGKLTLPVIYAYEEATEQDRKIIKNIFTQEFQAKENSEENIAKIIEIINKYNAVEKSFAEAEKYSKIAANELEQVNGDIKIKKIMRAVLDFSMKRNF